MIVKGGLADSLTAGQFLPSQSYSHTVIQSQSYSRTVTQSQSYSRTVILSQSYSRTVIRSQSYSRTVIQLECCKAAAVTTVDGDLCFEDCNAQVSHMLHSSPSAVWWPCDDKVGEASLCIPWALAKMTPEEAQANQISPHCWITNLLDANKKILGQAVDGGLKKMPFWIHSPASVSPTLWAL